MSLSLSLYIYIHVYVGIYVITRNYRNKSYRNRNYIGIRHMIVFSSRATPRWRRQQTLAITSKIIISNY